MTVDPGCLVEIVMSLSGRMLRRLGLDRNPLRRTSDRVEAWATVLVLVVLVAVAPGAAWLAGRAQYTAGLRAERTQRDQRSLVEATVLQDAAPGAGVGAPDPSRLTSAVRTSSAYSRVSRPARWVGPDGAEHRGAVTVRPPGEAGTRVWVWVDGAGRLTEKPRQRFETVADAIGVATLTAMGLAVLLAVARYLLRRLLDARRLAQWEEAWWRYEPRWSGRR
jgi:hypothetical protein